MFRIAVGPRSAASSVASTKWLMRVTRGAKRSTRWISQRGGEGFKSIEELTPTERKRERVRSYHYGRVLGQWERQAHVPLIPIYAIYQVRQLEKCLIAFFTFTHGANKSRRICTIVILSCMMKSVTRYHCFTGTDSSCTFRIHKRMRNTILNFFHVGKLNISNIKMKYDISKSKHVQ